MVAWDKECLVKLNSLLAVALVLGAVALTMRSQTGAPKTVAPAVKIAVIAMRDAMLATQEGQAAGKEMQAKYASRRAALEKEDAAIMALDEQLKKGAATMSADARQKMQEDIARRRTKLQRDVDDLDTDQQADNNRISQEITGKLGVVIDKAAKANGYTVVMDASAPLLWASESANITPDIIKAYDAAYPVKAAAPAAQAPAKK
jgi:outer membrane protein